MIPAAQQAQLNALSSQGLLSGVPPSVLAAIDQAESSGQGGAINPQGYGGYFGLGVGAPYPGGYQLPASTLTGTDPASFSAQAEAAAAEYNSLLASHGGSAYAAETAYQGGGSEGTSVFSAYGIPATISPGVTTPASTAYAANQSLFGTSPPLMGGSLAGVTTAGYITSSSGGSDPNNPQWQLVPPVKIGPATVFPGIHLAKSSVLRVGIGIVGIVVFFIAIHALAAGKPGQGPITVLVQGAKGAKDHAEHRVGDGFKVAGAAAAE